MLDRIDLQIQVPALSHDELIRHGAGEASATIRTRVECAHQVQLDRQGKSNNDLSAPDIDRYCSPDQGGQQLLQSAMHKMNWSARAYHRVLKVARSVADLEQADQVSSAA